MSCRKHLGPPTWGMNRTDPYFPPLPYTQTQQPLAVLFPGCSPRTVYSNSATSGWLTAETARLSKLVRKHHAKQGPGTPVDWDSVAAYMPGRGAQECRRYHDLCVVANTGPLDSAERGQLARLRNAGASWRDIGIRLNRPAYILFRAYQMSNPVASVVPQEDWQLLESSLPLAGQADIQKGPLLLQSSIPLAGQADMQKGALLLQSSIPLTGQADMQKGPLLRESRVSGQLVSTEPGVPAQPDPPASSKAASRDPRDESTAPKKRFCDNLDRVLLQAVDGGSGDTGIKTATGKILWKRVARCTPGLQAFTPTQCKLRYRRLKTRKRTRKRG
ncbi:MAG: hypothetical protein SGCHY_005166 [Lobulomycetales sp.]